MNSVSKRRVLVLGANGRIGQCVTRAFAEGGWAVIAQSRQAPIKPLPDGANPLLCDGLDADALIPAARGAEVIINALNPNYSRWETLYPPLWESVLRVARESHALLMLPGNVYNFGRNLPERLTEATPTVPDTSKARVRIALEGAMQDAAREGVDSVVLRAGDFFGGPGLGTWLDLVIAKDIGRGRVTYPGAPHLVHAWAYVPDLARTFVAIAQRRDMLKGFRVFHFAGHSLTGEAFHAALEQAVGRSLALRRLSWWPLRLAAPFAPMLRAILEMRYLWDRPHLLDDSLLRQFLGGDAPHTPLVDALSEAMCAITPRGA